MKAELGYLVDKILEIGKNNDFEVEVFLSEGTDFSAELDGENLDSVETSSSFGIGVRVIKDKKVGFAYSSKKDIEVVYKAMENLIPDPYTSLPEPEEYKDPKGVYYKKILDLDETNIVDDLISMKDMLKDENITVTGGRISKAYEQNWIANSKGVDVQEEFTYYSASISGIKDGETAYEYLTKNHVFEIDEIANKVIEFLKKPEGIKTDYEGNIALSPRALSSLLSYTLIPSFNAENIQRNRSVLKDKIGEKVFGENITIVDDGTIDGGLYSSKVDGEGVPTKRTVLVENGILKGYLYDIKRANIENKKSTGNGMRGYNDLPGVSPSNFIIEPHGKINDFDEYLYINTLIGTHTSNPITGDFSVEISNSYIVKDGEEIPVKKGLLSGNIFESLKTAIPLDNVEQRGKLISPAIMIKGKIVV